MAEKKRTDFVSMFGMTMVLLVIFTVISISLATRLGYPEDDTYEVEKVDRIWNTNAKERGYYEGDCYYMVYTDKGVFRLELIGLNAYAFGVGRIKAGETYRLKTRGARLEKWGFYPNIIEVVEDEE